MSIDDFLITPVEVLTLKPTTSSTWGSSDTWEVSGTIKGHIRYLSGREQYVSDKDTSLTSHRLYCKPSTLLGYDSRVQEGGRVYNVVTINRPTRADFLQVDLDFLPDIAVTT